MSLLLYFYNNVSLFVYVKNSLNYLSIPLICTVSYLIFRRLNYKVSFIAFMIFMTVYTLVGLIQLYVEPRMFDFLINMQRGVLVGGRGVVSISTEPAFYGSTCLIFIVFSLLNYNRRQNLIAIPFLLFQLVFLSRSATSIGTLAVAMAIFTVVQIIKFLYMP